MTRTESNASTVMDIPHLNPSIMAGFPTLSYSGMAGSRMVMGDGVILGLSDKTTNIAGDSRVKPRTGNGARTHGRLAGIGRPPLFRRHPGVLDPGFFVYVKPTRGSKPHTNQRTKLKDLIESFMESQNPRKAVSHRLYHIYEGRPTQ